MTEGRGGENAKPAPGGVSVRLTEGSGSREGKAGLAVVALHVNDEFSENR